ncbi:MAG: TetR/AcrR family transcriptional regulator [Actinomycetota bacterium]
MGRPPKFDDDDVLDRAVATFWRSGWTATSIRDLEKELELKAPSIYRRFGSRTGLGVAVLDHYVERVIRSRVAKYLSGDGDPLVNIEDFLVTSVTPGDDGRLLGCLVTTVGLEGAGVEPELRRPLAEGRAEIERGLRGEVRRAIGTGRLGGDADEDAVVAMLTLVMQGLMALARAGAPADELVAQVRATLSLVSSSG